MLALKYYSPLPIFSFYSRGIVVRFNSRSEMNDLRSTTDETLESRIQKYKFVRASQKQNTELIHCPNVLLVYEVSTALTASQTH